jgi:cell division protein FtsL
MARTAVRPSVALPAVASARRVMLLIGLLVAAFLIFFPTKQLVEQRVRVQRLEQRLAAVEQENAELEAHVRRLEDPAEIEVLAREKLGLVEPGERAYLFAPVPSPSAAPEEAAPVEETASWWRRVWDGFVSIVRGGGR